MNVKASSVKNTDITAKPKKKKSEFRLFRENLPITLLALPAVIYMFIFKYVPLYGLILPFKDYKLSKGVWGSPWCGLENFKFIAGNEQILIAVRNTILYNFVWIFLGLVITIAVALLLFEMSAKSVKVYQTAIYLPYYISWVIAAYAFSAFLDMDNGVINKMIVAFGGEPVLWYNDPKYWPYILTIAHIWKGFGSGSVIYYAALMGIDGELFEAAKIDGASKLKQIWYISLPSIKTTVVMLTILNIGKIFYGDFGLFYNFTFNSPLLYSTTDIVDTYVFRALTNLGDISLSATVGFVQSMLGFILVMSTNLITKKIDKNSALF